MLRQRRHLEQYRAGDKYTNGLIRTTSDFWHAPSRMRRSRRSAPAQEDIELQSQIGVLG
jgi:hypothetical protein